MLLRIARRRWSIGYYAGGGGGGGRGGGSILNALASTAWDDGSVQQGRHHNGLHVASIDRVSTHHHHHHHYEYVQTCRYGGGSMGKTNKEPEKKQSLSGGWTYRAIVNAPNIISLARLVSGPAIAGLIIHGHISTAVPLFVISGATDWLDGYLARKQGLTDNILGSYLDPLADKVLVGSVVCSMGYAGLVSPYIFSLILGRDACLVAGAFWARAHALDYTWPGMRTFFNISAASSDAAPKAKPLYISKVNTVAQIVLLSSCLADVWIGWPGSMVIQNILEPATALTTVWSLGAYIHAYRSGRIRLSIDSVDDHDDDMKKNGT